jgi:hypothetical protein
MTETEKVCHDETRAHIHTVRRFMLRFVEEIIRREMVHDDSKLREPELSIFAEVTPRLRGLTYGSDEYKEQLKELGVALEHHYANNDHHPEHHGKGVEGMNLFQINEMFCDWLAATERHDDGDIFKSIEINEDRFGISPQLSQIFRNTVAAI